MPSYSNKSTRAQLSRSALQRLYIAMRHLFIRGSYKPLGASGEAVIKAMMQLKPEIYGDLTDPERVELDGLNYIFQRLPKGIEECKYIKLVSKEGFQKSFEAIIPSKRRRNCFRIDAEQFYIEMTRGRSDIYDVLTHLTFMYIESEKIRNNALDLKGEETLEWRRLKEIVKRNKDKQFDFERGYSYLSTLIGRTFDETKKACIKFDGTKGVNSLFHIVYWLGKYSIDEYRGERKREISFSSSLREIVGHHEYGGRWAEKLKRFLYDNNFAERPIHIISSNLHSVMNSFYAKAALHEDLPIESLLDVAEELAIGSNTSLRDKVTQFALEHGMYQIEDESGSNLGVQVFDCSQMSQSNLPKELGFELSNEENKAQILVVMDYAFGEQAYECMDELLKPLDLNDSKVKFNIQSVNIMGKAGILEGVKGDIMIPNAHIFEGTADNYPFRNAMDRDIFKSHNLKVFEGPMITVLGTSLQNRDILRYFLRSSWKCVGLEMEGAHYQKAIQAASQIRKSISEKVEIRYAYYASDNPLETGGTLSSGALGKAGVSPTYLITLGIINGIFN